MLCPTRWIALYKSLKANRRPVRPNQNSNWKKSEWTNWTNVWFCFKKQLTKNTYSSWTTCRQNGQLVETNAQLLLALIHLDITLGQCDHLGQHWRHLGHGQDGKAQAQLAGCGGCKGLKDSSCVRIRNHEYPIYSTTHDLRAGGVSTSTEVVDE